MEKEKERSGGKRRGPKNSTKFALPYLPFICYCSSDAAAAAAACLPAASYGNRWVRTAQEMARG